MRIPRGYEWTVRFRTCNANRWVPSPRAVSVLVRARLARAARNLSSRGYNVGSTIVKPISHHPGDAHTKSYLRRRRPPSPPVARQGPRPTPSPSRTLFLELRPVPLLAVFAAQRARRPDSGRRESRSAPYPASAPAWRSRAFFHRRDPRAPGRGHSRRCRGRCTRHRRSAPRWCRFPCSTSSPPRCLWAGKWFEPIDLAADYSTGGRGRSVTCRRARQSS